MRLSRNAKIRLVVYPTLLLSVLAFGLYCTQMPGQSGIRAKRLATAVERQTAVEHKTATERSRDLIRRTILHLAGEFPRRNLRHPEDLHGAEEFLEEQLRRVPRGRVSVEQFETPDGPAKNLVLELPGSADRPEAPLILLGSHYDSAPHTPGADDNASGVAVALELGRRISERPLTRPVRVVLFANEEPPYFYTEWMGSWVHAKECRRRGERIHAMISLETLGYYSGAEGSQRYPFPLGLLYPSRGDFVAFVSNLENRTLVREMISGFRSSARFPSEGGVFPSRTPGVGWSDHWAFWQEGYPALMVTDTAPFRNPHYHEQTDLPEHLDYEALVLVSDGLLAALRHVSRLP